MANDPIANIVQTSGADAAKMRESLNKFAKEFMDGLLDKVKSLFQGFTEISNGELGGLRAPSHAIMDKDLAAQKAAAAAQATGNTTR